MRVRALDVRSASVDGDEIMIRGCTLAARTDLDGRRGWDASGWLRRPTRRLAVRAEDPSPLPVVLDTDDGRLTGSAYVSIGRGEGVDGGGFPVFFVGVGRLDPWPG